MSEAEELVRSKDDAQRRLEKLESHLRDLRLGRKAGLGVRRISLMAGVFGWGWTSESKYEVMPEGMGSEFYEFLSEKAHRVAEEVRGYEKQLNALAVLRDTEGKAQ